MSHSLISPTPISIACRAVFLPAISAFLLANMALAQTAPAASGPAASGATRSAQGIKLDFVNAEIAEVAKTFGVIMNRNIVVDPRVKGQMNLTTDRTVPVASAKNWL